MRRLITADMFAALRIVSELDLRDELRAIATRAKRKIDGQGQDGSGEDVELSLGVDAFLRLFELLASKKSERKIYEFLAGPFEMQPKDVEQMDWCVLLENVEKLVKGNDLKAFFTSLSRLISLKSLT